MAAPLTPVGVKVQGKRKLVFVPSLSLTAPSVAAATAPDALDVTNIFYSDGFPVNIENTKVTAPRRLGSTKIWEQAGTSNQTLGDLRYTVDPQGATGSDGMKAYAKFPKGTVGYMLMRDGIDVDTDLAVGQKVRVVPIEFLDRDITGDPNDEASEFTVVQGGIIRAPGMTDLVAMVA